MYTVIKSRMLPNKTLIDGVMEAHLISGGLQIYFFVPKEFYILKEDGSFILDISDANKPFNYYKIPYLNKNNVTVDDLNFSLIGLKFAELITEIRHSNSVMETDNGFSIDIQSHINIRYSIVHLYDINGIKFILPTLSIHPYFGSTEYTQENYSNVDEALNSGIYRFSFAANKHTT